jgi:hypothetical protein
VAFHQNLINEILRNSRNLRRSQVPVLAKIATFPLKSAFTRQSGLKLFANISNLRDFPDCVLTDSRQGLRRWQQVASHRLPGVEKVAFG